MVRLPSLSPRHLLAPGGRQASWPWAGQDAVESANDGHDKEQIEIDNDDNGEDDDDEVEGEDLIEELLWAAQMDLIAHRPSLAVEKLERAVDLGSSAACATLANIYARGLRSHSAGPASPSVSPPLAVVEAEHSHDAIKAAELFIRGLELELEKPARLASESSPARPSQELEDESTEGRSLSLERSLDLAVGLTDSFRYGIVKSHELDSDDLLWTRGALVAKVGLDHSAIADVERPTHALSSSIVSLAQSPRAASKTRRMSTPTSRSYLHPSTSLPSPILSATAFPAHQQHLALAHSLSPDLKLKLTIQAHLNYVLALHAWPTDPSLAETHWHRIVSTATDFGGVVGTREGDLIVQAARKRLGLDGAQEDWKLAKARGRDKDGHAAKVPEVEGEGGDALLEMTREREEEAKTDDNSNYPSPPTTPDFEDEDKMIAFPTNHPAFDSSASPPESINTSGANTPKSTLSGIGPSKFTPRQRVASTTSLSSLYAPRSPFAVRTPSIASVSTLPPDFGRYAHAASGWASEPTLAIDRRQHGPLSQSVKEGKSAVRNGAEGERPSTSPAWRRAIANKLEKLKPIWASGWESKPSPSKAQEMLSQVLKRDEASAGDGMYWGTEEDQEELLAEVAEAQAAIEGAPRPPKPSHEPFSAVASGSGSAPVSRLARPGIVQRRSFVDPTATDSTETGSAGLLRPPQGSNSRRQRERSAPSPLSGKAVGIDPVLLELERQSRVGVKTKCACCGKQGYNFPASKDGTTFCSRECRRGERKTSQGKLLTAQAAIKV